MGVSPSEVSLESKNFQPGAYKYVFPGEWMKSIREQRVGYRCFDRPRSIRKLNFDGLSLHTPY